MLKWAGKRFHFLTLGWGDSVIKFGYANVNENEDLLLMLWNNIITMISFMGVLLIYAQVCSGVLNGYNKVKKVESNC